jgi:hypothetical protein
VGFVTAGVSAAALGATWWLWPRSAPAAALVATPGGAQLSVSGAF